MFAVDACTADIWKSIRPPRRTERESKYACSIGGLNLFNPTCAHAWWALMDRLLSVWVRLTYIVHHNCSLQPGTVSKYRASGKSSCISIHDILGRHN